MIVGILFAAGRGSRLSPLTDTLPKPLLQVGGKSLLAWNMQGMAELVDEYVLVVGYLSDQVQALVGDSFMGKPVRYCKQTELRGTLDAFRRSLDVLGSDYQQAAFLVSNSDDIHDQSTYELLRESILSDPDTAAVSAQVVLDTEELKRFGVFEVDQAQNLIRVVEKPQEYVSDLVNTAIYYFPPLVREYIPQADRQLAEEFITDHLLYPYARKNQVKVIASRGRWLPVNSLADLQKARQVFGE